MHQNESVLEKSTYANNTTDSDSNFQFVRHVLQMDSTFPGNRGMWRALNSPVWHTASYLSIIAWETVNMILYWLGGFLMARVLRQSATVFHQAKRVAIAALKFGLLMWFVVFLSVGGEWFLMWQSKMWNGQDAAFRMLTVIGIILLFVVHSETESQP